MAVIEHEIKVRASQDVVFAALSTPAGMRGWHSIDVQGSGAVGSEWHLRAAGAPDFVWLITASQPNTLVAWECTAGPGNSVGTTAEFQLSETPDGRTLVVQSHRGWSDPGDNFRKCNTLWGGLMHHLREYVETQEQAPALG